MWDCKYKVGKDGCRRRKTRCYPGGKLCVLGQEFSFPLRKQPDELDHRKNVKETKIKSITPRTARKYIEKQESIVIDIRARDVFDQGHIPGAVWVDKDNLDGFIHTADRTKMIICCCYKGVSSLNVARAVQKAGFSKVCSLKDGFAGWSQIFPQQ